MADLESNRRKHFSRTVMDFQLVGQCSEGMYKAVKEHCKEKEPSMSEYLRRLVRNDLNIDDYGKEIKEETHSG